jgi:hypothetical protein
MIQNVENEPKPPFEITVNDLLPTGAMLMLPNSNPGQDAAKTHKYSIGTLVEFNNGVRLWVVHHARDCDQTPLYCLSADPNDTEIERQGFYNASWVKGIAEQYLTFIRMVNAPEV